MRSHDVGTPKEINNWKVYGLAIVACMAAVMIGYDSAFIGTSISLQSFKDEFGLNASTSNFLSANIVSTYQAGCFFGAFSGYPLGFFFGRRWGLFIAAMVFNVGAVLQIVASEKTGLGIMYAGRAIVGWGVGVASNLTPVYVAEISPPAIRGRLMGLYEAGWQVGAVVGFWINYGINRTIPYGNVQWRISFAVQLIPSGLLGIGCIFLLESPRWLASKDRNAMAVKNLSTIRGLDSEHPYVLSELADIHNTLERDRAMCGAGFTGPIKALFQSKAYLKRLAIAVMLFAGQNGTGINAINYYSPTVFKSIGVTGTNTSLFTTGIFGIIKFLGAIVWLLFLVDRFGRRTMLFVGSIGGALSMYAIGAYIAIAKPTAPGNVTNKLSSGGIVAMFFFYLWTVFYSPTWNGTPWVFGAEVFPTYIRVATQSFVAGSNWLFAFIIARFTPQMFKSMGYGVYLLFASLMVVSIFFVYFFVPETSHIQLERMDELFSSELKPWKAHAVVIERQRQVQGSPNVAEENASVEQKMVDEDNKERRDHIEYV
ncbi:hypothetical protein NliqN6_1818 [Naganishia liquefaciens]|uniref:Quinate transporter n=1 Tax=Naganishia liquefaciens TaxID=104408 RepID=A0A8H3TR40_9TREE|nr:hypothetical protein NliqN6_1818 [Naganishia liquefaciens]